MEEVIEDDLIESGIGVGASGAGEGAVGVDDVGGIEVLNGEGACIGDLDVGLIEASAFLEGSVDGSASDGGSVIGAGDIDCNGGEIGLDAIGDGDVVVEGEGFAVSEELEGG